MRSCISIAMRRHALASSASPFVSGSPKKISMASPTNLSIVPPWASAILDISGEIFVEELRDRLRLEPFRRCREILDIGEKDRKLLALGVNGYVLLSAENALVDLRRKVARYFHRQRSKEVVGRFEFRIYAADNGGLASLQGDEKQADRGDENEIGQQIFEREQVAADRLGDRDFLQPANVADFPIALRAFRVCVMAANAGRGHDDGRNQANAIDEK